ncbi:toprim domain-containing protein [Reichenbachiella sp.]|uniref:toprim domain-containing protein n=1 Tax=Reichenbachiella sp. TaxID=2184521 RepID=UPI003BB0EAF9
MNCYEINQADPVTILLALGINYVTHHGNEYTYFAFDRKETKPSLCINIEKKLWHDHGTGQGGKLVDLLMQIYKTDSVSVMLSRFNQQFQTLDFSFSQLKEKGKNQAVGKSKLIMLSVQELKSYDLIKYLSSRGISKRSWGPYIEEMKYMIGNKNGYGIAFKNDSGGYEVRTEKLQFCLGKKDITTLMKDPNELLIFEGFIDFLSLIELNKYENQSVIVLNSTTNTSKGINKIMSRFMGAKVDIYMDNDNAGLIAFQSIQKEIPQAVSQSNLYAKVNDLNDLLTAKGLKKQSSKKLSM